ncbi:hypothetical protein P7C70_g3882, partial [Phenoliferia sp. Uapishka_3]
MPRVLRTRSSTSCAAAPSPRIADRSLALSSSPIVRHSPTLLPQSAGLSPLNAGASIPAEVTLEGLLGPAVPAPVDIPIVALAPVSPISPALSAVPDPVLSPLDVKGWAALEAAVYSYDPKQEDPSKLLQMGSFPLTERGWHALVHPTEIFATNFSDPADDMILIHKMGDQWVNLFMAWSENDGALLRHVAHYFKQGADELARRADARYTKSVAIQAIAAEREQKMEKVSLVSLSKEEKALERTLVAFQKAYSAREVSAGREAPQWPRQIWESQAEK